MAKNEKENRDADLRWIHGVIVQAAWFVKASLGQNAVRTCLSPRQRWIFRFLVTARYARSLDCGERLAIKNPRTTRDNFIYMQVHDVPPEPENGYDLVYATTFSHISINTTNQDIRQ